MRAGIALELLGVDVDADQIARLRKVRQAVHVVVGRSQFGAHREGHIGLRDQRAHRAKRWAHRYAQRMLRRQQSTGVDRHDHRSTDPLGELPQ